MHSPDNSGGITRISERTVSRIVEAASLTVPGCVKVDGGLAGRDYPRFDVEVDDQSRTASVEAIIAVSWPSPVTSVAEAVRATIQEWLRDYCGLRPTAVNVITGPVVGERHRVTQAAIDSAPRNPDLTPVKTRNRATISSPTVSDSIELREIHTAPEQPLEKIHVRRPMPEVPVTVAKQQPLRPVQAPKKPAPLAPIDYPRDHPTRPVVVTPHSLRRKGGRP
ncbi:Asp23/Gls24 family envelope stress response protein [Corynebacterium uropygiale]|uniref:Asp23/Gls24 family envelope stress response protein n=1 Tax=Corynebacterium uropygiale TaxID=1775911 RepID=A0A9X1U6P0_9CORY|nr:Asp23/Gls24 family envelope stress response protein [Corynebacterium uropygiale]MCF4005887.1 Asp23/Gls24 family envelope stress response protein [Corynebacterium uropygiale]